MRSVAVSARGRLPVSAVPWTERTFGRASAIVGAALIVAGLIAGWISVEAGRGDHAEPVAVAVAVILSRAALAVAAMRVGYALLALGERRMFSRPSTSSASHRN
ncbi:MAG TPA: hypothetical protein VGI39_10745 [Polyangiaceae bacterium]